MTTRSAQAIDAEISAGMRPVTAIASSYGLPYRMAARYARRVLDDPGRIEALTVASMDAVATFTAAFGMQPTDYQIALLSDRRSTVFLKSRQCGATQAAAALAICTARSSAGADVVVVSPSLQQSKEVTTRTRTGLYQLDEPLVQDSTGLLRLKNGSRVISLPGNARAVRGYAPALVIVDEASWVLDETYAAIRPLLAASHGRLVCQSTPGRRGRLVLRAVAGGAGRRLAAPRGARHGGALHRPRLPGARAARAAAGDLRRRVRLPLLRLPGPAPAWSTWKITMPSSSTANTSTLRRIVVHHGSRPMPPASGVVHGVCLGPEHGVIVSAELRDGLWTATGLQRYGSGLEPIAAAVRGLLADDPGCRIVLDRGLRGRELADSIGKVKRRRRLQLFEARAEDRRYEVAGRLTHAIESKSVRIVGNLLEGPALRRAVSEATREDAGDRPELVALSLAVVDRRPPRPQIL